MIWLISKQGALIHSITALLLASHPIKHLSSLKQAESELDLAGHSTTPALILLDSANPDLIATCRELCRRKLALDLPLIALIARPEDREPALAAGADDYLLLPLVPAELQQRLKLHLVQNENQLMAEQERLHQEVMRSERLATVGRLTAVLSHEINNPMQAIQGALMLAVEGLNEATADSEELLNYITLSLAESERVVQLIEQMRQIYNPQAEMPCHLQINDLLRKVILTARKALKRQKVMLYTEFVEDLPPVKGMTNQLHLAFLSLLLNLSDRLGEGGGEIRLRTAIIPPVIRITLAATPGLAMTGRPSPVREADSKNSAVSFGLFMGEEIIRTHLGRINLGYQAGHIICNIELPFIDPINKEL